REARRGFSLVHHDVRAVAGLHHRLCGAGDAERAAMSAKLKRTIVAWAVLSPLIVLILFPFAVMFITAIKPQQEVLRPTWWPSRIAWQNFIDMWSVTNFGPALWNSVYVAVLSTLLALVVSIPAAYALNRYRFAGQGFFRQFLL